MGNTHVGFDEIYSEFYPKVLGYLTRLAGQSDAEDIAQEVFVKVHKSLGEFRGDSKLTTWIYKIATNAFIDKKREAASRLKL